MSKKALRSYVNEIEKMIDAGKIDEAIFHCVHILQTYPKHLDTTRLLGKAYLEKRLYSEAASIFNNLAALVPDDFVANLGLSIIKEDEGDLDQSIRYMERAFEFQPSNVAIQNELKRLKNRLNVGDQPKIRLTRGSLARMYEKGQLYPQAIAETMAALAEEPDRHDLLAILARIYDKNGNTTEAIETCEKIISISPYSLEANRILSKYFVNEQLTGEINSFKNRLIELDPYFAMVPDDVENVKLVPENSILIIEAGFNKENNIYSSDSNEDKRSHFVGINNEIEDNPLFPSHPLNPLSVPDENYRDSFSQTEIENDHLESTISADEIQSARLAEFPEWLTVNHENSPRNITIQSNSVMNTETDMFFATDRERLIKVNEGSTRSLGDDFGNINNQPEWLLSLGNDSILDNKDENDLLDFSNESGSLPINSNNLDNELAIPSLSDAITSPQDYSSLPGDDINENPPGWVSELITEEDVIFGIENDSEIKPEVDTESFDPENTPDLPYISLPEQGLPEFNSSNPTDDASDFIQIFDDNSNFDHGSKVMDVGEMVLSTKQPDEESDISSNIDDHQVNEPFAFNNIETLPRPYEEIANGKTTLPNLEIDPYSNSSSNSDNSVQMGHSTPIDLPDWLKDLEDEVQENVEIIYNPDEQNFNSDLSLSSDNHTKVDSFRTWLNSLETDINRSIDNIDLPDKNYIFQDGDTVISSTDDIESLLETSGNLTNDNLFPEINKEVSDSTFMNSNNRIDVLLGENENNEKSSLNEDRIFDISSSMDSIGSARELFLTGDISESCAEFSRLINQSASLDNVIGCLTEMVEHNSTNLDLWRTLGDARLKAGHLQEALDAYTHATELIRLS